MGRRLSSWERSQRESERLSRAAGRRALTASRRKKEASIREKQQATEKRAKAAQTASEIAQNRSIVSKFENYIHNLESLHNKYALNKFEKDYEYRLRKRAYKPGTLKELTPFKKEQFTTKSYKSKSYKSKPYKSHPKIKTYRKKSFKSVEYKKSDFKKEKDSILGNYLMAAFILGPIAAFIIDDWMIGAGIFLFISVGGTIIEVFRDDSYKKEYDDGQSSLKDKHDQAEAEKKAEHDGRSSEKIAEYQEKKAEYDEAEAKKKAEHDEAEAKKKAEHDEAEAKKKAEHDEAQAKAKSDHAEQKKKGKASFEKRDALNKKKFNENDVARITLLKNAKDQDVEAIETICESVLPIQHDIEYPEDFVLGTLDEYDAGYNVVDHSTMDILIQLPEFDDIIPSRKISATPNGKTIQHGDMSNRARSQLFDKFVSSMAFEHAVEILRAYPYLDVFRLEAFNTVVDTKTGGYKEKIILKVVFDKETLLKLNLDRIDPVHAIENFDFKFLPSGKKSSKEIEPDIERDGIVWATPDNKGFEIPYGVHPDQKGKRLPN